MVIWNLVEVWLLGVGEFFEFYGFFEVIVMKDYVVVLEVELILVDMEISLFCFIWF